MANGSGSGGKSILAFVLGALVIVVAVIGFFMYSGGHFGPAQHTANLNVHVTAPTKP
jgi:hypothetical protein